jgi:hypothetical protein
LVFMGPGGEADVVPGTTVERPLPPGGFERAAAIRFASEHGVPAVLLRPVAPVATLDAGSADDAVGRIVSFGLGEGSPEVT